MSTTPAFPQLQGQQFISLTTFRKSGEGVATPVWFAVEGDRMYIITQDNSGKIKRIRRTPRVTMAASDSRGQVHAGAAILEGLASITPLELGGRGDKALRAKYGWKYSAFGWFWSLRRITPVIVEVRPG